MDPLGNRAVASPEEVERQLSDFWREASTDEQAVMRACSMNLVVVCADDPRDLSRATELVAAVAETVPGRAIVVGPPRGSGAGLDVYVAAHCHRGAGGAQVCSEQVTLEPAGAGRDLVPGTVLQLLVEDMPVHTWWRLGELADNELLNPLVGLSDAFILDSATTADAGAHLRTLLALASRARWNGRVKDAAWARLEPWREAIASFFDDPARRPALDAIARVEVAAGGPVAFAYLMGWLVSRLRLRSRDGRRWMRDDGGGLEVVRLPADETAPGDIASVRIEAEQDGSTVVFDARLASGRDDRVVLDVSASGHRSPTRMIELPALDEAGLICGVLQQTGRDPVFDAALARAARIV